MPALHSLGMVEHVDGAMLDNYEQWMIETGNDSFKIHEYEEHGGSTSNPTRKSYLPIISIDSKDAINQDILGTDLGSLKSVASQLPIAIRSGKALMAPIPNKWPLPGNTLMFQPAYFGLSSPKQEADREELYAGGIWMSIDLDDLLLENIASGTTGVVKLTVRSADNKSDVIEQSSKLGRPTGVDVGFGTLTDSTVVKAGASKLIISYTCHALMPKANLIAILSSAMSLFIIGLLVIAFGNHWRIAQQDRLYSLRAIAKERENAELTLKSINDSVVSLDAELAVVYLNPSAQKFLQLDEDELLGERFEEHVQLQHVEGEVERFPGLSQMLSSLQNDERASFDVNVSLTHLLGSTIKLTVSRMRGIDGDAGGCILVLEDVSKERKLSTELEFRANHDALTGSYNRFYFDKRLAQLVEDVPISSRSHALCYIDLDQFKIVNDTCGHPSGDRLLCELTDALRERLRASDVLARLGGDEFGIIICDADHDAALIVANKLYEFFQNFVFEDQGRAFPVHASIEINSQTGSTNVTHYEFLLRLKQANGEILTPFKFIKAAERYDLMREIDCWVISNALATVAKVQDDLPDNCTFSINLSGQSAGDSSVLPFIAEQMRLHGVEPRRFWFEITETAAITHFSNAVSLIEGIQALGSSVALDDFGSGLSSFGYLRQLPVNILKIDGQFIQDIDKSDVAKEMVRAMHHVGRAMGLKTVAEFVEKEAVVKELASIGVDYAQGFFIAMPCPAQEALDQFKSLDYTNQDRRKAS